MNKVGLDTKVQAPITQGPDLVGLDLELGKLRQAGSLQDIGAALRSIAEKLPEDKSKGVWSGLQNAIGNISQAVRTAFQGKPTGLRDLLSEANPNEVKLFLGTTAPSSAAQIAKEAGITIGDKDFKLFSTGDPFTFLGKPADASKKVSAEPENVAGKTVFVLQGGQGTAEAAASKFDLPTQLAESLQVAFAAKTNGAKRVVLLLPESLNPSTHPNDEFAQLAHRLAIATGIHADDIKYVGGLDGPKDGAATQNVRLGLPNLGPKTREVEQALVALDNAKDLKSVEKAIKQLDVQIGGLEGKHSDLATQLARKVADTLAIKMSQLVPGFGENNVVSTGTRSIVLGGQSNPELAEEIAQRMGASYSKSKLDIPPGGAPSVDFGGNVSGKNVVIVQTSRHDPANAPEDRHSSMALLAEALLLYQSAVNKGATDVKLVLPYMPNARSDKNDQKGVGAYAGLVARWVDAIVQDGQKLAEARGKRLEYNPRVVLVEPHDPHTPVFFRTPVDVVSGGRILVNRVIEDLGRENLVLVCPDEGAVKRTGMLGKETHLDVVKGAKTRADNNEKASVEKLAKPEEVRGKKALVVDDEIATGGTMMATVKLLAFEHDDKGNILMDGDKPKKLADEVHIAVSHANMPLDAEARFKAMRGLRDAGATRLYLLDTQPVGKLPPDLVGFVHVASAADAIAQEINTK